MIKLMLKAILLVLLFLTNNPAPWSEQYP